MVPRSRPLSARDQCARNLCRWRCSASIGEARCERGRRGIDRRAVHAPLSGGGLMGGREGGEASPERVRELEQLLESRERLAALGTMAAGLAHELNNPAAAAKRAASLLKEQVAALEAVAERLASRTWSPPEVALLRQLAAVTGDPDQSTRDLDALARSDREDAVGHWLEAHGIEHSSELAPVLVERG